MSQSRTVSVTIECEVFYDEVVDKSYGEDADGNRGVKVVTRCPTSVAILELVPPDAVGWIKARAIEEFEARY